MEDLGFFSWTSDSIVSNHPLPSILKLLMEHRDIAETLLFTGRLPFRLIGVLVWTGLRFRHQLLYLYDFCLRLLFERDEFLATKGSCMLCVNLSVIFFCNLKCAWESYTAISDMLKWHQKNICKATSLCTVKTSAHQLFNVRIDYGKHMIRVPIERLLQPVYGRNQCFPATHSHISQMACVCSLHVSSAANRHKDVVTGLLT